MVIDYFYHVFICMFHVITTKRILLFFPLTEILIFSRIKKHVVQKIEIITAIVTQT